MKRPTLSNDNMVSLYSGRNLIAQSPKSPLISYSKPIGLTFNSPKGDAPKTFSYPQKQISASTVRIPTRPENNEPGLERKNSKTNSEIFTRVPGGMGTYIGPAAASSRQAKVRGTSTKTAGTEKVKVEQLDFNRGLYNGLNYSDSTGLMKQTPKSRALEINTEVQTYKATGNLKAYSTKNNTSKAGMGPSQTQASLDYSLKYPSTNQSLNANYNYEYMRTDPGEEKKALSATASKPKNALSRILNSTNDKTLASAGARKVQVYDDEDEAHGMSTSNSAKINNFFNNSKRRELENSLAKKDKTLNISTKFDQNGSMTQKGDKSLSATVPKKNINSSQMEYKVSYKQFGSEDSQDDIKRQEDSRNMSLTGTNANLSINKVGKSANTQSQKGGLNSFITKVEKGAGFPMKAKNEEESSGIAGKPYLSLEEGAKGNKTSSNAENRTITFSKAKLNQQPLASSSKEGNKVPSRASGSLTPSKKQDSREPQSESGDATPLTKDSDNTYYITSLERYHKKWAEPDYFCQIYKEHFIQSYQALAFCKYLRPVDPKVLAQKKVFLPKKNAYKDKRTIIFDLDETLIHCNESTEVPSDVKLPIRFPHGEIIEAGINIRPYAVEILKEVSKDFEVIIFTASHSCYANVVLDYLDPNNQYISHRLFRENCVVTDEGIYIKDLRILGNRNLADVVLVDNAAYSFGYQVENGIPIVPYYDNKEDIELMQLIPYIKSLANVKDVRDVNKHTFKLQQYPMYDSLDKVLNKVVLSN